MTTSSPSAPSLAVSLGKLRLQNPMMTASGTCGYANEYADFTDLSQLGAFVTKAISRTPRKGNESIRVIETRAGMLNAIGLANIGLDGLPPRKNPPPQKNGRPHHRQRRRHGPSKITSTSPPHSTSKRPSPASNSTSPAPTSKTA